MWYDNIILIGIAACGNSSNNDPGKYTDANVNNNPAHPSNIPMITNGIFDILATSVGIALLKYSYLVTGNMYAKHNGMYMNVVIRLSELG